MISEAFTSFCAYSQIWFRNILQAFAIHGFKVSQGFARFRKWTFSRIRHVRKSWFFARIRNGHFADPGKTSPSPSRCWVQSTSREIKSNILLSTVTGRAHCQLTGRLAESSLQAPRLRCKSVTELECHSSVA